MSLFLTGREFLQTQSFKTHRQTVSEGSSDTGADGIVWGKGGILMRHYSAEGYGLLVAYPIFLLFFISEIYYLGWQMCSH